MRRFTKSIDFKTRGCESNFAQNILLFNKSMANVNLRMNFGVCRDFETDIAKIRGLRSADHPNLQVRIAPKDYFSSNLALNCIPARWFDIL